MGQHISCVNWNRSQRRKIRGSAFCKRSAISIRGGEVWSSDALPQKAIMPGGRVIGALPVQTMANKKIKTIRIHPAIGIARLGNSPESCFIGPEIPGVHPDVSLYRDREFCLKRQGARF